MRQSFTAVLERNRTLTGEFTTEPYEVAWASEARWFVRTLERQGAGTQLKVTTQVSPDGLYWCDLEPPRAVAGELATWPSAEFGGWLRLKGTVEPGPGEPGDGDASAKVLIYLALKA